MPTRILTLCAFAIGLLTVAAFSAPPGMSPGGALSPHEELATFRVPRGFRVELVACEPDVVDPVAMAFDERGRLYVAEMRGYPNGGVGTGQQTGGRVRRLEDRDGDGTFETATTIAAGLRFPTAVMPWRGGVVIGNAPDILYVDVKGNRRVLYTGFDLDNIQQLVNSLQFGIDNWIHGIAGNKGGVITCPEKPDAPPVNLRGRGFRFRPDVPGSLEPTSGGGQYGLAADEFGNWFTATNNQHLRHIVLPDHALRRNPNLTVDAVTHDIPDHGAACKVFRLSPFESWRVERTTRRLGDPAFANWPGAEKVPGGFITSGCSPVIYSADRFPPEYRGNCFVCDPANNLIHRDRLEANGVTFVAKRADEGCEFLASTDNWFRPVWLTLGPDGAIYVLDFYREVIETPLSLPDDIKAKLNLESRGRGRIWRIVPDDGGKPMFVDLSALSSNELVDQLQSGNAWQRLTAQRLIFERHDRAGLDAIASKSHSAKLAAARVQALWTLDGLDSLNPKQLEGAIQDADANVREHAIRLAVSSKNSRLAIAASQDPALRVRMQSAIAAGSLAPSESARVLATILERDGADPWMQTIALSSASGCGVELLAALVTGNRATIRPTAIKRLAAMIGSKSETAELAKTLQLVAAESTAQDSKLAILEGLGQGLRDGRQSLAALWANPPSELADAMRGVRPLFERAAADSNSVAAIRLLAYAPFDLASSPLMRSLSPQSPPDLQVAALRSLAAHNRPEVAAIMLDHWDGYGPALRREAVEALCARPERLAKLLDALESKHVSPAQIEPARRNLLRKHSNNAIRKRAIGLLAASESSGRARIVAAHRDVLEQPANSVRGAVVFKEVCSACHRLDNVGHEVGADLRAALGNKTAEVLLIDILDPNREVDPRYVVYQAVTTAGRSFTGVLAVETPASITLRRADGSEDTILRSQLESLAASSVSLMPEELEKQLSKQQLADVIAYLLSQKASR